MAVWTYGNRVLDCVLAATRKRFAVMYFEVRRPFASPDEGRLITAQFANPSCPQQYFGNDIWIAKERSCHNLDSARNSGGILKASTPQIQIIKKRRSNLPLQLSSNLTLLWRKEWSLYFNLVKESPIRALNCRSRPPFPSAHGRPFKRGVDRL